VARGDVWRTDYNRNATIQSMREQTPITGKSPLEHTLEDIRRRLIRQRAIAGKGIRLVETDQGTVHTATAQGGGSSPSKGAIVRCRVMAIAAEWLSVVREEWDEAAHSSKLPNPVPAQSAWAKVALPFAFRESSYLGKTVNGATYSQGGGMCQRKVSMTVGTTTVSAYETITPKYEAYDPAHPTTTPGSTIYTAASDNGTNVIDENNAQLLDFVIDDGREWKMDYRVIEACLNGVTTRFIGNLSPKI
jgi:hypothetical protein